MKPKNYHRGLSHKPVSSTDHHAPAIELGKIARIHRTYHKQRKSSRRRSRETSRLFQNFLRLFFILFSLALVYGICWVLYQK